MKPRIERDCLIEVGCLTKQGRPSYRWEQGWVIVWSKTRRSTPMSYREAQDALRLHTLKED